MMPLVQIGRASGACRYRAPGLEVDSNPTNEKQQGPDGFEHKYLVLKDREALNLWCSNGRASCHPLKNAFFNPIRRNRAYLTAEEAGDRRDATRIRISYSHRRQCGHIQACERPLIEKTRYRGGIC